MSSKKMLSIWKKKSELERWDLPWLGSKLLVLNSSLEKCFPHSLYYKNILLFVFIQINLQNYPPLRVDSRQCQTCHLFFLFFVIVDVLQTSKGNYVVYTKLKSLFSSPFVSRQKGNLHLWVKLPRGIPLIPTLTENIIENHRGIGPVELHRHETLAIVKVMYCTEVVLFIVTPPRLWTGSTC